VPISEPTAPEGIVHVGNEWYFDEFAKNSGVSGLGLDDKTDATPQALPASDEKKKIMDLFKN
jgi:penicillin-binding protein 1A